MKGAKGVDLPRGSHIVKNAHDNGITSADIVNFVEHQNQGLN